MFGSSETNTLLVDVRPPLSIVYLPFPSQPVKLAVLDGSRDRAKRRCIAGDSLVHETWQLLGTLGSPCMMSCGDMDPSLSALLLEPQTLGDMWMVVNFVIGWWRVLAGRHDA